MATVLIVPFGGDLKVQNGKVELGPRTKACCDQALALACAWQDDRAANVTIFTPAGRATKKRYRRCPMGFHMHHYLNTRSRHPTVKHGEAAEFTSLGEIEEVLRYLAELPRAWSYDKLIFVCEDWRYERIALTANAVIRANHDRIRCWWVEPFRSEEPFWKRLYWHAYEFLARLKNRRRLAVRYTA